MRLIDADVLLKSFDIAKMVEYDETGCGVTRIAIPIGTIKNAPTIDTVPVRHEGTTTFIDTDDIDKFQSRIILTENQKSKFCRMFYEEDREHGQWDDEFVPFCNRCSQCSAIVDRGCFPNVRHKGTMLPRGRLNYCPNCGAKMDAKED